MFQWSSKSFLLLMFAMPVGWAQTPPAPPPVEPAKPAEPASPLPPLPYTEGVDHRFQWEHKGVTFATTTLRIETVKDEDGGARLRVRGRLSYERAGRVLNGSSDASYRGDIAHPVQYQRSMETLAPGLGSADATIAVEFEGPRAAITRKDTSPTLARRELVLAEPIWLLDDQCFEHWALLAPYFSRIVADERLTVFVPHGENSVAYTIRKERTEGEGDVRRDRWSVRQPTVDAKIWTDAEGRLVEYQQGEIRIFLEGQPPPGKPAGGDGG